ncbi:unnamed protein product [Brachionus calyciflorus]|uniref:Vesicle transport v-SNARE N-terminal domain-containing protein n=1 Tax=Brachionus calyciflorus TaxID=104777 RepID=A0A813YB51_9BILA|nr:unnamed protein product [Brachionus calyciflorus]
MANNILRNYEQQFGVICADITNKISVSVSSSTKSESISTIESLFDDATEIIEQMELEIRDANSSKKRTQEQQDKYLNIINSYKSELAKLKSEFNRQVKNKSSKSNLNEIELNENNHEDSELFELKQKNKENVQKMNNNLENGYRMVLESEETGKTILSDLFGQREQMQRSRDRLREVNMNLGKSSRVVGAMTRKALQNKLILIGLCAFLILTVVFVLYLVIKKRFN